MQCIKLVELGIDCPRFLLFVATDVQYPERGYTLSQKPRKNYSVPIFCYRLQELQPGIATERMEETIRGGTKLISFFFFGGGGTCSLAVQRRRREAREKPCPKAKAY